MWFLYLNGHHIVPTEYWRVSLELGKGNVKSLSFKLKLKELKACMLPPEFSLWNPFKIRKPALKPPSFHEHLHICQKLEQKRGKLRVCLILWALGLLLRKFVCPVKTLCHPLHLESCVLAHISTSTAVSLKGNGWIRMKIMTFGGSYMKTDI